MFYAVSRSFGWALDYTHNHKIHHVYPEMRILGLCFVETTRPYLHNSVKRDITLGIPSCFICVQDR